MSAPAPPTPAKLRVGDVVFAGLLLVLFVGGYLLAQAWPFRAALFPQLLSAAGIVFAVLKLAGFAVQARRRAAARTAVAEASPERTVGDVELVTEDDEDDRSLEYVFATAGRRAWGAALGWVAGFFLALWLFGVLIAVPVFALLYLRFAGKASWSSAAIYAAVVGGVLYVAFGRLLSVPMPNGIL